MSANNCIVIAELAEGKFTVAECHDYESMENENEFYVVTTLRSGVMYNTRAEALVAAKGVIENIGREVEDGVREIYLPMWSQNAIFDMYPTTPPAPGYEVQPRSY